MYWSTLGVTLLGRALGRRWQEQMLLRSQAPEESDEVPADPMVADKTPVTTRSNANERRHRSALINKGTAGRGQESIEKVQLHHPSGGTTLRKPVIEKIVAKRTVGSVDFYKVKYLHCPESCNAWVRKPKIARRMLSKFEAKFARQPNAPAISLPYPYGSKPDWPPMYRTRFDRSVYPTWKVIDGLMTEHLLGWLKEDSLSVNKREPRTPRTARRNLKSRLRSGA